MNNCSKYFRGNFLIYSIIAVLSTLVFTAVIYNIIFVFNIYRYICIIVFYFILFLIVYRKTNAVGFSILVVALTPILIDCSVLFTNYLLVPLRFPYASTFTLLGCLSAYFFEKRKKLLPLYLLFLSLYFVLGHFFVIPEILYSKIKRNPKAKNISNNFINQFFYGLNKQPIKLSDILGFKSSIVECYFVGCPPCEQKKTMIHSIRNSFTKNDLSIIMICNGAISSWDEFQDHYLKNKMSGIIYLYDKDSVLFKNGIYSHPTELLLNKTAITSYEVGFMSESSNLQLRKKTQLIQNIINEKSSH
jgi:hypothetical protein